MNYCKITCLGHVGLVQPIKSFENETKVLNFSVAFNQAKKKTNGEYEPKVTWLNCSLWGVMADYFEGKFSKGDQIILDGTPEVSNHNDKQYLNVKVDNLRIKKKKEEVAFDAVDIPF